uniref:Uncharacterized protein n=2 Tax=Nothobranchius kadleci TaxID=1051664 RepID=A0A1A8BX32_NOTKA
MPQISTAAALQIALLFSAVPAQYLISRWSGPTAAQRYHATTRLLRVWKEWRTSFLNQSSAWIDWTNQQLSKVKTLVGLEPKEPAAQTPPVGTMIFDNDKGFFGDTRPDIPTLDNYFTHFDGTRFIMQPWLRELFPEDEDEDA